MSQQIPKPLSKLRLRKGFLVTGIVVLILGFFSFYWASRISWDYVTTYKAHRDVGFPSINILDFGFGNSYEYPLSGLANIEMQPDDSLTLECSSTSSNETVYIVLNLWNPPTYTILNYGAGLVTYINHQGNVVQVFYFLAIPLNQNIQNTTVSTTATLHHYETPQWVYFGIGTALCTLAMIPIFKSRKQTEFLNQHSDRRQTGV